MFVGVRLVSRQSALCKLSDGLNNWEFMYRVYIPPPATQPKNWPTFLYLVT